MSEMSTMDKADVGAPTTKTKPPTIPRKSLIRGSKRSPPLLNIMNKTSSARYGAHMAPANGQPRMLPAANQKMPCDVLSPPCQFIKAAVPNMPIYMAKLEGR